MLENLKKRLSIFLAIIMVMPAIVAVLPMAATKVSAAENVNMNWRWEYVNVNTELMQIEKGQKFYIGDYASIGTFSWNGVATMVKAKYSSSKPSVVTVNSEGYLTAKKVGTTTITIKYKGKKLTTRLEVVPAGTFGKSKAIIGLEKQAEKLAKQAVSKITAKNGFALKKAEIDYRTYSSNVVDEIDDGGVLKEKVTTTNNFVVNGKQYTSTYTYTTKTNKLAVPQAGRYYYASAMLNEYSRKNSPTATNPAKKIKITSASATTRAITLKLKKKFTAEQILGARIYGRDDWNKKVNNKTAYVLVNIYDPEKDSYYCAGKAEFKKGSNKVKITPIKWTFVNGVSKCTNMKLEKGKTYRIGYNWEWAKGKTIKVK